MVENVADNKEIKENKDKIVALRPSKGAKATQRKALYNLLSSDEEYANLSEHIIMSAEMENKLDDEIKNETKLTSVSNVMQLIQYDVQGYSTSAISNLMKIDNEDVLKIRRSDAYKSARSMVMAEVIELSKRTMEISTIKAVKTLMECMESKNDKVKLSAAVEVLNITGLNATQKIELTTHNNSDLTSFTDDELAEILRGSQGIPVDAEVISDGE